MNKLNRALDIISRINHSNTPARTAARASKKVARLAEQTQSRSLFWVASALRCHGHALALEGINDQEMAVQVERRDRSLKLACSA